MADPQDAPRLLAAPNFSAARDAAAVEAIIGAAGGVEDVEVVDTHVDPDHDRCVVTLAGPANTLPAALVAAARIAVERIDLRLQHGAHPRVGSADVVPLVYPRAQLRGHACAAALVTGDLLARELGLPVLVYGELAEGRGRAELRRGGLAILAERLAAGELSTDFGPARAHPTAGVTLVGARPPLVAFNVELAPPASVEQARAIAARIREGGEEGIAGLRAIGLHLAGAGIVQVSCNVERPGETRLADIAGAVTRHAPVAACELVGLAPAAALEGWPDELELRGFDPGRSVLENHLD